MMVEEEELLVGERGAVGAVGAVGGRLIDQGKSTGSTGGGECEGGMHRMARTVPKVTAAGERGGDGELNLADAMNVKVAMTI